MVYALVGASEAVFPVVPGSITTPLTQVLHDDPVVGPEIAAMHPIGRLGKPKDMAGIAVFLASDDSAFATASHFFVDGGISGAYVTPL